MNSVWNNGSKANKIKEKRVKRNRRNLNKKRKIYIIMKEKMLKTYKIRKMICMNYLNKLMKMKRKK